MNLSIRSIRIDLMWIYVSWCCWLERVILLNHWTSNLWVIAVARILLIRLLSPRSNGTNLSGIVIRRGLEGILLLRLRRQDGLNLSWIVSWGLIRLGFVWVLTLRQDRVELALIVVVSWLLVWAY